jgi:MinD superfamily P-loop ATPase
MFYQVLKQVHMNEIVIISGKGGTGKTSITASFALLGMEEVVVADCDVDAANMHLLLKPDFAHSEPFYSGEVAEIDTDKCINCGECKIICRFDAVHFTEGQHHIEPLNCEGCGYCARICPEEAITNKTVLAGNWFVSKIRSGSTMVHARLGIGADNSGKLVARVRDEARKVAKEKGLSTIVIDGSPGIGCPVISSLTGASYVVLVTEPTLSGLHDLKRVLELVRRFGIEAGCIINKADINPELTKDISSFLKEVKIKEIASIPYDESFTEAMTQGKTILEVNNTPSGELVKQSWKYIHEKIN